jgi:hypothetical protein
MTDKDPDFRDALEYFAWGDAHMHADRQTRIKTLYVYLRKKRIMTHPLKDMPHYLRGVFVANCVEIDVTDYSRIMEPRKK